MAKPTHSPFGIKPASHLHATRKNCVNPIPMADTNSSGRNNGRDGGRSGKHRGMRSGRHDGNQTSGQNVKRKIRRNHAPGEKHEDETNGSPDEPNSDEERANPLSAAPLFSDRPTRRVFQPSSHNMPSFIQERQGGEGYGVSEGGPGNGYVISPSCFSSCTSC